MVTPPLSPMLPSGMMEAGIGDSCREQKTMALAPVSQHSPLTGSGARRKHRRSALRSHHQQAPRQGPVSGPSAHAPDAYRVQHVLIYLGRGWHVALAPPTAERSDGGWSLARLGCVRAARDGASGRCCGPPATFRRLTGDNKGQGNEKTGKIKHCFILGWGRRGGQPHLGKTCHTGRNLTSIRIVES
jgi:hypothetical protein